MATDSAEVFGKCVPLCAIDRSAAAYETVSQAYSFLRGQHDAFAASLKSTTELQFMQLRQVARLVGGRE